MSVTITDNLFAAGKGYAIAVRELYSALNRAPAAIMAVHFLAGFSFELSLKAAIFSVRKDQKELRKLGHDLLACLAAAKECGYLVPEGFGIEEVIAVAATQHSAFNYRYVPDVDILPAAALRHLLPALTKHIDAVESQFDVWSNTTAPSEQSLKDVQPDN